LATIGLLLVAVGCTPNGGGPSNSIGPSPSGSAAAEAACQTIELRTPAGDRIDLNGTWVTEKESIHGGIYYFRQVGSCIWFAGGFTPPAFLDVLTALGFLTVVFEGTLSPDFTIHGAWIDARNQGDVAGPGGTIDLRIDVGADGTVRLVYVGGTGEAFLEPGYHENESWIKISDDDVYPPAEPAP
jgi:hypothetical protein